ncbi:MAG: sulfurtransferase [Candidatus Heimdallarchaeota archaeon]|nr:sulfurtransferase [Candidatus Heimdallarchaeota archaeon]
MNLYTSFISCFQLNELLLINKLEEIRIIDCRIDFSLESYGKEMYLKNHIPNAIFIDLETELSDTSISNSGRHPLPPIEKFNELVNNLGILRSTQVIVYDDVGGGYAARLWFMMTQLGINTAILEGGFVEWVRLNLPVSDIDEKRKSNISTIEFINNWNDGPYVLYDSHQIKEILNSAKLLYDSRSLERFAGIEEPFYAIAGHIPGAKNHYWMSNLNENSKLLPIEDLSKIFPKETKNTIFHCGSGVTACLNLAVAKKLNLENPGLYVGSWSAWIENYPEFIETDN